MKLLLLLALCGTAHAQTALPNLNPNAPGALHSFVNKNGACVWWFVDKGKFTEADQLGMELNAYCATPSEFAKIGGRVQTIVAAAEPLKSLQTLPSRISGMTKIRCPGLGKCAPDDAALLLVVKDLNDARGVK
jgi:hypothetical protein